MEDSAAVGAITSLLGDKPTGLDPEQDLDETVAGSIIKSNDGDEEGATSKHSTKLTFREIVAIQASYSAAANIFQIPSTIGIYGYVFGPVVFALWFFLEYYIAAFVCDVVAASRGRCKHFSDVGFELMGTPGRRIFQAIQLGNMLFYIPLALESAEQALRTIFGKDTLGGCVGYWKLIVFGILFVIMQVVKNFKESSSLAFASLGMAFLQACVFCPTILSTHRDSYHESSLYMGPGQPFLHPGADWWT